MKRILLLIAFVLASIAVSQEIAPNALLSTNVARYRAVGTLQISCTAINTTSAIANISSALTDLASNATVGNYNGTFYNTDGSFTRVVQSLNSTMNMGALTNFLAVALRNPGTRALDRVVFLTRYDTVGGVLPAANCTDENVGTTFTIPFEASYGFYRSATPPTDVSFASLQTSARATGDLRYTCTNGSWVGPSGINSTLTTLDEATAVGIYNGSFVSTDGSRTSVVAGSSTAYNVAPGAALAYFLARASPISGNRTFDNISYITRYDTVGGVPQASDVCNSTLGGTVITKTFSASYNFYAATNVTSSSSSDTASSTTASSTASSGTQQSFSNNDSSDASFVTVSIVMLIALLLIQ